MATARLAVLFLLIAVSSAFAQPSARRADLPESPLPELRTPSGRLLGWDGRALSQAGNRTPGRAKPAHVASIRSPLGVNPLDGRWSELGPPVRLVPSMILDAAHHRLVVFGGVSGFDATGYRYVDDTWVLDLEGPAEWKRLEIAGPRPEPRAGHGAAYDAARHRLVIFGGFRVVPRDDGYVDFRYMSDTWALNLDGVPHWEPLAANGPQPDPRSGLSLVCDGARDRALMLGGFAASPDDDGTYFAGTWALDLGSPAASWTLLHEAPNGPEPRAFGLAAKDEATDRLIVFGGQSAEVIPYEPVYHRDVWTLGLAAGGAWERLDPPGPLPPLRFAEASTWDQGTRRISLFGGVLIDDNNVFSLLDDFWSFDLADVRWTQGEAGTVRPQARENASMAPDGHGDVLLFSGDGELQVGFADTWQWSYASSGWREHGPGAPLPRLIASAGAFDEVSRSVITFGGGWFSLLQYPKAGPYFAFDDLQAWSVDRGSWSHLAAQGPGPSPRYDAATAFDPARRRMWIVGGSSDEGGSLDDTWALELADGPRWRALPSSGPHPLDREGASAIFDVQGDRVILYGGTRSEGADEVWQLKDDTWTQLSVQGSLPPRTGAMAVYDSKRHRMITLGGAWYDKFDTWALSLDEAPTWTRIEGGGETPPPSAGARAVYDPHADRVLLFGGVDSGDYLASATDVYELSLADPPSWRRLQPAGDAALPRSEHLAFFDTARNRLLVTGGWDGFFSMQAGSYALSFGQASLTVALDVRPGSPSDALPTRSRGPLPVALLSAPDFDPAQVDVASLRLEGAPASVPARPPSDWNGDGTIDLLVEFDPAQMQPHGERLTLTGALIDGTPIEGTAIVSQRPPSSPHDVSPGFAIRSLGTSGGGMRFAASLRRAGAWNVDLFDVRGRRIAGAQGVADAAGEIALELPGSPSSGVYFVRLRSGGESTHTRLAWTRP